MSEPNKDTAAADSPRLDFKATHTYRSWKHTAPLLGCRYDPTARYVFASSMDHGIHRWDLQEDLHATFTGHESWLRGIGFSPDSSMMYSGGYDGRLCFWPTAAASQDGAAIAPTRTIEAHAGWIRWLAVSPDGSLIATAGNDLKINLWSAGTGELVQTLLGHEGHIYSLFFHPGGELLLSGDLKGVVNQWELATGKLQRTLDAKPLHTYHGGQQVDYGGVRCMSLSADGTQLACGGLHKATNPFAGVQEPLVLVFDWESGKQIRTHEATGIPRGIVWRLMFQADGTLLGSIGGDIGALVFWQTEKTELHKFNMPSPVLDLDQHRAAPEVASVHHDGHVRLSRLTAKA